MSALRKKHDSSLQKLIRMVEDAEKNQAPAQRIADKWASWLVPVALIIAIAAWFVTGDIVRGVTFQPFVPLITVALIYLALVMLFTRLVAKLEKRLRASDH